MPRRPLGPCSVAGCPGRAVNRGRCAAHAELYEQERGSAASRGYGGQWRHIRDAFLAENPFCVVCGEPATDADHIVPRAQGGTDARENLQAMCHRHHSAKTMRQSVRNG